MDRLFLAENGEYFWYKGIPFCDDLFNIIYYDKKLGGVAAATPQTRPMDLYAIVECLKMAKKDKMVCVELGSFAGQTTCLIALWISRGNGKLYTIDNFKGNDGAYNKLVDTDIEALLRRNLKKYGIKNTKIIKGDTCSLDVRADFVFVDAGHTYSACKRDLDYWWPRVNPGGIMCGHDLNAETWKEEYIEIDYIENKHHGVAKAVYEKFGNVGWFGKRVASSVWWVKKPTYTM